MSMDSFHRNLNPPIWVKNSLFCHFSIIVRTKFLITPQSYCFFLNWQRKNREKCTGQCFLSWKEKKTPYFSNKHRRSKHTPCIHHRSIDKNESWEKACQSVRSRQSICPMPLPFNSASCRKTIIYYSYHQGHRAYFFYSLGQNYPDVIAPKIVNVSCLSYINAVSLWA